MTVVYFVSEAAGGYIDWTRTGETSSSSREGEEPLVQQTDTCEESALNPL